jgi:hypothetical protein
LFALNPDVGGFRLAPGAHASIPLEIMSEARGQVGVETFAMISPRYNGSRRTLPRWRFAMRCRFLFFMSLRYPRFERMRQFERYGVQVLERDGVVHAPPGLVQSKSLRGNRDARGLAITRCLPSEP